MVVKIRLPGGSALHEPPYTKEEIDDFYKRVGWDSVYQQNQVPLAMLAASLEAKIALVKYGESAPRE